MKIMQFLPFCNRSNYSKIIRLGVRQELTKVIGMFKDEAGGRRITEFVGLRAKVYSLKMDVHTVNKCKGGKKAEVKKSISFQDYKDGLFTGKEQLRRMNVIRSHKHEVIHGNCQQDRSDQ